MTLSLSMSAVSLQEAAEDVSATGSKAGHGVSGAFSSAGSSIKGAAHKAGDKVSHAADKVRLGTCSALLGQRLLTVGMVTTLTVAKPVVAILGSQPNLELHAFEATVCSLLPSR